ncbi:MAG: RluA family pseudouridine synthase [Planctomycetota bacterium]|nr:RluA family pseudouridine synthase [Planctomycetota bacterium]
MAFQGTFTVETEHAGQRLDVFLAERIQAFSRTRIRVAITAGQVAVDGKTGKPAYRLLGGEKIECSITMECEAGPQPEEIPLDILYDDDDIVFINKPPAMVVHPSKGHWQGTLTAALAYHFESLSSHGGPQRPGIVHRLDRDTSGVIVVAKNDQAHVHLARQFEQRTVEKEYLALVTPPPDRQRDWIDHPIGPHPYQREKMAIRTQHPSAKNARTFYEVQEKLGRFALVKVLPKTGRTHQIRVHFQHVGCPVAADKLYSGNSQIHEGDLVPGFEATGSSGKGKLLLERQALHARKLSITHPNTGEKITVEAPVPADMSAVIQFLRQEFE